MTSLLLSATLLATFIPPLGCANTEGRIIGRRVDDQNLGMAVGTQLLNDPEINRFRIDVDTRNSTVVLRGEVASEEQKREAERIARQTQGVERVINELQVSKAGEKGTNAFEDAWIVTMVSGKIARDPGVASNMVDVDVTDGVVTLSGTVDTPRAKREAEDLAESVDGVIAVNNQLVTERGMRR